MKLSPSNVEWFFSFMVERESIRLKKLAKMSWPWTKNKILQTYSFTNVKREHDKTSQLLISEFYKPNYDAPFEQLLLNCAIARYFGTIEFMRAVGWQKTFDPEFLIDTAHRRIMKKQIVFTGAYIITSGGKPGNKENYVVNEVLTDLWKQRVDLAVETRHSQPWFQWNTFIHRLQQVNGFGGSGFMAKEVTLDTRYTSFWRKQPEDMNMWTPVGPGSMRGSTRILGTFEKEGSLNKEQTLEVCIELFKLHKKYWPKDYVELELTDIQFQLCEWDKYERTRLGQGRPRKKYKPQLELRL